MTLPSNVSTCEIAGRFMRVVVDGEDTGVDPDGIPIAGVQVTITPTVTRVRNVLEGVATTIFLEPITAETDSEGVLVHNGAQGVRVVASDNPDLTPTGFTHTVKVTGPGITPYSFSIIAPSGGVVNLATVAPVPENPGAGALQWLAVVAEVTSLRDEAVGARTEAEIAAGQSVTAQAAATTAATSAAAARTAAEAAQTASSTARTGAEAAQTVAVAARTDAESARDAALAAVVPATETVAGISPLATPAQAVTGTDASRSVTPAGVRAAIRDLRAFTPTAGTGWSIHRDTSAGGNEAGTPFVVVDASGTAHVRFAMKNTSGAVVNAASGVVVATGFPVSGFGSSIPLVPFGGLVSSPGYPLPDLSVFVNDAGAIAFRGSRVIAAGAIVNVYGTYLTTS